MNAFDCLIVGAGHGGSQTAISLRKHGFVGTIGLMDAEDELPYERPPLTKGYLAGETTPDRLRFSTEEAWQKRAITLLKGQRIVRVSPAARTVQSDSGDAFGYKRLVWAAGGTARRLGCPGAELEGIYYIRSRSDVDRLSRDLSRSNSVVIIGGGYIGLEAAAVLTRLGKRVTVVEAQDRLLSRVTSDRISQFIAGQHRAYAVDVRLRKPVDRIEGSAGRVSAVLLSDGTKIATDLVIVGIGISPSVQPLLDAGAAGDGDVFVDETCQTSIDDVFAVGDCANHANIYAGGRRLRLESVQNATDQAEVAASNIAGNPAQYAAIPWFWSNQYDIRLQSIGLLQGYDDLVVRGDPVSKKFSVVYLRDSQVIALDCVNSAKDFIESRKLIGAPAAAFRDRIADQGLSLKSMI